MSSDRRQPMVSASGAVSWTEFDPRWYLETYGPAIVRKFETDVEAFDFYMETGQRLGHSPNPFFDESWYLRVHPDVSEAVRAGKFSSGFDHYVRYPGGTKSPHWLFDPVFYEVHYPDLTPERLSEDGFVNSYDQFLRRGDMAGRSPSPFFTPEFYRSELNIYETKNAVSEGAFRHYLRRFCISLPEL